MVKVLIKFINILILKLKKSISYLFLKNDFLFKNK